MGNGQSLPFSRQKSLPQISTLFYPLGGRCLRDDASIHCNGKGAEYLEVQRVEHLQETELLNQQVHLPFQSDETALVTVQLDMFECGGVAIAYRPNFPTGLHLRPRYMTGFTPRVPAQEIQLKPRKVLMKKYVFSGAAISKLKAAVSAGLGGSELLKRQLTRVEIVIGLVWNALNMVSKVAI
ncbi:hypothetical protein Peur_066195 [Populus x canadensis]